MPGLILDEDDLCLYVTEKCNSNCAMCPMSAASRRRGNTIEWEALESLFNEVPSDIRHVTITGGEPFLEFEHVIDVMNYLNMHFPQTEVLVLTNGRALAVDSVYAQLEHVITDKYTFAIPIHASTKELHDRITQAPGSFVQTIHGLKKIADSRARIEIRIVGHRQNVHDLDALCINLANSGIRIDVINLVAMEMTGCAAANRNDLWVDYQEVALAAEEGLKYAITHGIDVGLYNFPLCSVPNRLWPLVKNSITPSKIRYGQECGQCAVLEACGGMFYSTFELGLCQVHPIGR